jgi:membrane-associated phospholipid phosphatase
MMSKLKEKFDQNPLRFMIIAFTIYSVWFFFLDNYPRSHYTILHCAIDDLIPFNTLAVYPYISWFPLMVCPMWLFYWHHNRKDLWNLLMPVLCAMFSSLIIYMIWPNGLNLRPAVIEGNTLSAWIARFIESSDTPNNVCPSIHVSTTLLIDWSLQHSDNFKHRSSKQKTALNILCLSICIAVMVVKQHSFIDVCCGAAHALIIILLWKHFNLQY